MNSLMEAAGERLNLKLHGVGPGGAARVCGPADIEGAASVCLCVSVCVRSLEFGGTVYCALRERAFTLCVVISVMLGVLLCYFFCVLSGDWCQLCNSLTLWRSGHRGKDGLYYVVDTARLFPPEAPRAYLNAVLVSADQQVRRMCIVCDRVPVLVFCVNRI